MRKAKTPATICVAAADDHPYMLDGYRQRLENQPGLELVATCRTGEEMPAMLAAQPVDLLIADIELPTSEANPRPYETLVKIAELTGRYPSLDVLVISYHNPLVMMNAALDAGASGYIQKDDMYAYDHLAQIIRQIKAGETYFPHAYLDKGLAEGASPRNLLSPRQIEVMAILAVHPEMTTQRIAQLLSLRPPTVRNILSHTYLRLGVTNRASALMRARELGLLDSLG
ncbi:MAG: response regulator transcription factor [Chloroflexi bacterium]|nr:response regulator transcription factor [Chloroflexota bacterium]